MYAMGAVWGDQQPHLLFWDPLYISKTNRARMLKSGTLVVHLQIIWLPVKICPLEGAWGDQQPPIFILRFSSYFLKKLMQLES